MHGKGTYTWKDGRRYDGNLNFSYIFCECKNLLGEYHMDKKHGYGVYIWADSRRYEGLWQNGKQHGKGKYILPNSTVKVGIW